MDSLIPLVNRLQYVFRTVQSAPLSLPQLVVVGSQSAGKSSVLEAFVGKDFLPRGSGIVTRRPLILQLVHEGSSSDGSESLDAGDDTLANNDSTLHSPVLSKQSSLNSQHHSHHVSISSSSQQPPLSPPPVPQRSKGKAAYSTAPSAHSTLNQAQLQAQLNNLTLQTNSDSSQPLEWGEFSHRPNQRYTDFHAIREEIVADTERIAGSNKGISHEPIILTIHSPKVLNLTLVDLPGLTKVAIGDQPQDIELQIQQLILQYVTDPNSIIVAVTPANIDIVNSEALKLAKDVDPTGVRTIGVITKLDLMDRGTDAMDVLAGNVVNLQHGFVGVVNRSQHDINTNKSILDARQYEQQFFSQHPIYRTIAHRCGSQYLCKKLSLLLMSHIHQTLPDLKTRLVATYTETQHELDSYGNATDLDSEQSSRVLLQILSNFSKHYTDALDGKLTELSVQHLYGGARLKWLFNDVLRAQIDRLNPFDTLSDNDIRVTMSNASGAKPALFISEVAFELLIKKQIERLLPATLETVDLVHQELHRVAQQCQSLLPGVQRFPAVKQGISQCVTELLASRIETTKAMITSMIEAELAYINTAHPAFIGGSNAVAILLERYQQAQLAALQQPSAAANGCVSQSATVAHANGRRDSGHKLPSLAASNSKTVPPLNHSHHLTQSSSANGSSSGLFSYFMRSPLNNSSSDPIASGQLLPSSSQRLNDNVPHLSLDANTRRSGRRRSNTLVIEQANGLNSAAESTAAPNNHHHHNILPATEREISEIEVIKLLIRSYFDIVKTTVADMTPKFIIHGMVNYSRQHLHSELVKQLYRRDNEQSLLAEATEIKHKRAACQELLTMLNKALSIINETNDTYTRQWELG